MKNKSELKKLLAVSAVAAMFSAWGAHAQTSAQGTTSSTSQGSQNMSGKTTRDGTVDNSNSWGKEQRDKAGSQGATSSGKDQAASHSKGSSASGATASGGGTMSKADQKIMMNLARANIAEIEAGKLAQSKSQNDQVKGFAQQMIDDHSKALTELQQMAQTKGVTLPTEPDAKHKAMASKLEKMSGDAFDKAYMAQAGLADHKKVHTMLMADQKRAKDADLKAAVTKTIPVVEQHLKSAEQMPAVKSGTTSGK